MSNLPEFGDKLEGLDLSQSELDRLTTCMKDEKFRNLFQEYAEEIANPENKKRYEEEILQLEKERGMDVKFINPDPGHVIKTTNKEKQKCFINICTNDVLGKPKSQPSVQGSTRGMQWSIPHSVSQPRQDLDRSGNKCVVYDVVFHPDTYYMLTKNHRFKQMIHDTAIDAIEKRFDVIFDKDDLKFPKMEFKGTPMSSIIRTPTDKSKPADTSTTTPEWLLKNKMPTTDSKDQEKMKSDDRNNQFNIKTPIVPEYTIKHRGYFDMQDLSMIPSFRKQATSRPKELVISIDLPKIKAASSVNLEIFEKLLKLKSSEPVQYKLEIKLPYPVDETKGFAKFDKSQRKLNVTLEVQEPEIVPDIFSMLKDQRLADYVTAKNQGTDEEKKAVTEKKSKYTDSNQIHYNEGPNYCSDEEDEEEADTEKKFDRSTFPLVHTSEYLIEMITKHDEGLIRICPQYIYFQNDQYVTIIADISHIFKQSIWYVIYDDKIQFVCLSECIEKDLVNSLISLWVVMEDGVLIDPSKSRIDISTSNVVFLLRKVDTDSKWQKMKAGLDPNNLQTRLFATAKNISELFTVTQDQSKTSSPTPFVCCKANKNEKDFLLLDLEPKTAVKPTKAAADKEPAAQQPNKQQQGVEKTNVVNKKPQQQQEAKIETKTTAAVAAENGYNKDEHCEKAKMQQQPASAGDSNVQLQSLAEQLGKQMTLTEDTSSDDVIDSDDDEDDDVVEANMVVDKEVIINHQTTSALKLSTADMVFQLDGN